MEQEIQARTRESIQDKSCSDQSLTYYFSKFQLFQHHQQINQFYLYSLFLEKVSNQLGRQWHQQANVLCAPQINNRQIFMNLLSIWLHLHPIINRIPHNNAFKAKIPVFNQSYVDQFMKRIKSLCAQKTKILDTSLIQLNSTSAKAICMGFFLTANQIWEQMFMNTRKAEQKKSWMISSVQRTLQQSFKPLMVVTQKISHLFGRKRVKTQEIPQKQQMQEQMFGDCYMDFRKNIDLEKQIQRKLSDFCLDEEDNKSQEYELKERKQTISRHQFQQEQSPLQKNKLSSLYQYVTKFISAKSSWQVANSFVTNILDINHKQTIDEGANIKVLRPAQDFYQKLLISWITLKQHDQNSEITYDRYIQSVKIAFGKQWKSKYKIPTRYFYDRLTKHWSQIQKQTLNGKLQNQQLLKILIKKIRESMKIDWQRKIKVQKKGKQKYEVKQNFEQK